MILREWDGRMPIIGGEPLVLPRRELAVLVALMDRAGAYASKEWLHSHVFEEESEARLSTIECHISKLRKKLKDRLGYDPIQTKRYLGYSIKLPQE